MGDSRAGLWGQSKYRDYLPFKKRIPLRLPRAEEKDSCFSARRVSTRRVFRVGIQRRHRLFITLCFTIVRYLPRLRRCSSVRRSAHRRLWLSVHSVGVGHSEETPVETALPTGTTVVPAKRNSQMSPKAASRQGYLIGRNRGS